MKMPSVFRQAFDHVDASAALRALILTELARSERHWHGLLHHALMLRSIARVELSAQQRRRLTLAVLFHDIVYDATRLDNEEASAALAATWVAADDADAVAAMILATKHHDLTVADASTRALLEADLAILWTPSARLYDFYARGIRLEYAHVPDAAYRVGRRAVLARLEQQLRPALSPAAARRLASNLARERAALAG